MRIYTLLGLFLLFVPLFFSCMREDLTECLDGNLLLSFSYEEGGQEVFSEVATSVDILLFDTLYRMVRYERIEDRVILAERAVTLELPSGDYYLVSWMNRGVNSSYGELREDAYFDECRLLFSDNANGDPLYYGPKERAGGTIPLQVKVEEGEDKEETIRFTRAHRTFRFYIEGVKDEYSGENLAPLLDIKEVPSGYDFLMNLSIEEPIKLRNRTELVTVKGRPMASQEVYLPVCPLSYDIEIEVIKNSDSSFLTGFNLAQYLRENPPEDEYEIDIYIGFFTGGIEITVPGWNSSEEITPGW